MSSKTRRAARSAATLQKEGWWEHLSETARHAICLLALLALAFAFYTPVLFSGLSLIGGDTVNWRAMAEYMVEYERETGEPALWAPNAFGGMPGYMISYDSPVPQVDDVASFLRQVIWPASHFIFLLVGTYLFVFFVTRDRLAGVLSAAAYGLTTYLAVILVAGHNSKFIALCFAPWLVLAFAYALRRPKLLSALLFAIALGANLRAGHVQITYYVTFLLGVWWIVELVGAIRRDDWKPFAISTGWLALGSVLGLLLVAQPYLANYEYKQYTIRGATEGSGALDWTYAMGWSQGFGELITLIAADAFGGASPTYWGPKPFTSGPHYIGAIVVLLAIVGVWRWRKNVVIGFAVAAVLMTLFSLGEHFGLLNEPMFRYFPLFDAFRVPETWLAIVVFALAVLGGIGLFVAKSDESAGTTRAVYGAAGGMAVFLLITMAFGDAFFDFEAPNEAETVARQLAARQPEFSPDDPRVQATVEQYLDEQRSSRAETFGEEMMRALIFVLLAGAALVAYRRGAVPGWMMQVGIVLLVVIDLWGVDRRYLNEDVLVRQDDIEDQIATYDFDQFLLERQEEAGGMGRFRVLSLESGNPFTNARPSYHYESIGGYHGAKLRLIQDYIDQIFVDPETGRISENALDLLNTRYVIARGQLPGTEVVYRSEQTGMFVLENPDVVPRAYFVGRTEVIQEDEEVWSRIRSASFDPSRTAILPAPIEFETTPIDSASTARVDLESYSPRQIVWSVETDAPRLLVASELYYPAGWEATVDGEAVPIYRANYLLRAVPVPAGNHQVVMRFEPAAHRAGVWISGISTLLIYGLAIGLATRAYVRRRRENEVAA